MSAAVLADLSAATMELRRIRMALGWEPGDGPPPDPVAVIQMLRDPVKVHAAMLRGEIATPDVRTMLHIHGAAALERWDRADALEAALSDVLEMAQEHADHFAQAFAGYKPERHAHYAKSLATARALLNQKE